MPRTRLTMIVTTSLAALLLIGISATQGEPSSKPADDLKAQVTSILEKHCIQCHKNADRLMGRIVPGDPEKSLLYQRAAYGHKRKGPKRVCTADEVKAIAAWINSLNATSQPTSEPAKEPAK